MGGAENPGKIQPGCLDNGLTYYLGIQPPMDDVEKFHVLDGPKYQPAQHIHNDSYDILVYRGIDLMIDTMDTDEAFMEFAGELKAYLGERVLADRLKVIKSKDRQPR